MTIFTPTTRRSQGGIDVNPLLVTSGVGESLHLPLFYPVPVADPKLGVDEGDQFVHPLNLAHGSALQDEPVVRENVDTALTNHIRDCPSDADHELHHSLW